MYSLFHILISDKIVSVTMYIIVCYNCFFISFITFLLHFTFMFIFLFTLIVFNLAFNDSNNSIERQVFPFAFCSIIVILFRLFTYDEYAIYQVLCTWVYLKLCPEVEIFPPYVNVMTYFVR